MKAEALKNGKKLKVCLRRFSQYDINFNVIKINNFKILHKMF